MSVSPTATFPPPADPQAVAGRVRETPQTFPPSGNSSTGEAEPVQGASVRSLEPQDEVKLQWDTSDRVEIYQFMDQQGSLIVQVPSEQMLSIAREIAQTFAQESALKEPAPTEGGKGNGR
jgi:hypothetical protein